MLATSHRAETLAKLSRWFLVFVLLAFPFVLWGAAHIKIGSASAHAWLPEGRAERARYEDFIKHFGSDQFLVVSWDGATLEDERLGAMAHAIQRLDTSAPPLVSQVSTSRDVISRLVDPPLSLSLGAAKNRLEGSVLGAEGVAALFIRFTPQGVANQHGSIELVRSAADSVLRLHRNDLQMVGSVYEAYAVDQAAGDSLNRLVIPSSLMGILLAWLCLRSVRGAITVLLIAGVGQLIAIALVAMTGGEFSAVLIVLPTLVFMLTLSAAVHFMNYYHDVAYAHRDDLGARAILLGLKPSVLATLTTALGMIALATSQLAPVRTFGLYSASALCLATIVLLFAFPYLSDLLCRKTFLRKSVERSSLGEDDELLGNLALPVAPWASQYAAWVNRNHISICALGFVLIGVSFYGLLHLKSSTKFDEMFPKQSPTVRAMQWFESNIGPIASVEVMLKFPKGKELDSAPGGSGIGEEGIYDQAVWVEQITKALRSNADIGGVLSATSFLPKLPTGGRVRDVTKRAVLRSELDRQLTMLKEQGWVAEDEESMIWRVTAKVSALSKLDYGQLTDSVRRTIEPIESRSGKFRAEYTGLSPIMHDTQLALLADLGSSFSTAFLLITPVMMLIARGIRPGLLIMIPNILPETLVFGTMAWMGYSIDIAGILTASVAMGIAVNDTLHFVNWYTNRLALGDTREQAIADAFSNCGKAMVHTMLISCCSMLPFLFAEFNPTRQFATLMIAMMSSSILGDLVLLPALLLSPLGKPKTDRLVK